MCIDDRDYEESIPLSVTELTNGNALKDFDANTWTFSSKLYPMIKELASTYAGQLAATPFYLAAENNFTTVRANFKVGGVTEGVVWTSDNAAATVNEENIIVTLPEATTRCNLVGTYHGEEKVASFFILDKESATGIADNPTKGDFKMYVVNRYLTIENVQDATISIYDLTGKAIDQQQGINNAITIMLPSSGLYIVKVIKENNSLVEKIIVK